ncbi:MAG: hypothetical protein LGR52_08615 [Candidatus Thiosymbion ectosymbiont of Robbea hypermnestra]|nr:hypothetical protein [Candidatus Thiosymbion ectosymbiont of Robbea hypermnestra]
MSEELVTIDDEKIKSAKTVTTVIYALQAVSLLLVITFLIAVIFNYIKKSSVQGTWLASHFRWQIKTFWFGLLWWILGFATLFLVVGYYILIINTIWIIYRIVRGWLSLLNDREMYV